jgi:hypothetical protein
VQTLQKLKQFTDSIRAVKSKVSSSNGDGTTDGSSNNNSSSSSSSYHGQVLEEDDRDVDPEQEKRDLQNWFVGKLKCKKHIDDSYRNKSSSESASAGDGRSFDDYTVFDPRKM